MLPPHAAAAREKRSYAQMNRCAPKFAAIAIHSQYPIERLKAAGEFHLVTSA